MKQLITIEKYGKLSIEAKKLFVEAFEEFDASIYCFNGNNEELFIIHSINQEEMLAKVRKELSWYGIRFKTINENTFEIL